MAVVCWTYDRSRTILQISLSGLFDELECFAHTIHRCPMAPFRMRIHFCLRACQKPLLFHHGVPVVASTADQRVRRRAEGLGGRRGKRDGSVAVGQVGREQANCPPCLNTLPTDWTTCRPRWLSGSQGYLQAAELREHRTASSLG